jgi:hypothetical protein
MGVLVGGESKLGSTEDNPRQDKVPTAQPHPIDHVNNDNERPTGNMHTEGSNGIYGLTHEACWVCEGVSHPPPRTECRCVHIAVLPLCLSVNVSLSLSQPQSELFLTLECSRALFGIV